MRDRRRRLPKLSTDTRSLSRAAVSPLWPVPYMPKYLKRAFGISIRREGAWLLSLSRLSREIFIAFEVRADLPR